MDKKSKLISIDEHMESLLKIQNSLNETFLKLEQDNRYNQDFEFRSAVEEARYSTKKAVKLLQGLKEKIT